MINLERSEQCGQLPDFVNPKVGGYFFDIIWDEGDCIFNYQTKWSPHTDILIQIAKRHNVDFIHDYEEMGNLTEIGLDNDEFEQYHYDEETETYHFQGKIFDNDCEILEILLEESNNQTKLTLVHTHMPEDQVDSYRTGWLDFYFKPMKEYFG